MASSELSSSEINQGQGEYHDGKNELPGIQALPAPVSPSDVPLEVEEGIWKRFSSHYEFPLSLMIALGIHAIAILIVIAYMTVSIYWGSPKNTEFGIVTIEQPRMHQDGNEQQERPGGSNGNEGDPFALQFDPLTLTAPDFRASDLEKPSLLPAPLSVQPKPKGLSGKPDGGIGDISGPGVGKTPEVGVSMGRNKRWKIRFNYDEPEVLLSQFANLQVTVACRPNNGRFLVYQKLSESGPFKYEELATDGFTTFVNQEPKKLWFINNDRVTCENFAYAVNLSERLLSLVLIIPPEMEQAILTAELKHHHMTEDQVRAKRLVTSFQVVREGTNWKVTITNSEVLK